MEIVGQGFPLGRVRGNSTVSGGGQVGPWRVAAGRWMQPRELASDIGREVGDRRMIRRLPAFGQKIALMQAALQNPPCLRSGDELNSGTVRPRGLKRCRRAGLQSKDWQIGRRDGSESCGVECGILRFRIDAEQRGRQRDVAKKLFDSAVVERCGIGQVLPGQHLKQQCERGLTRIHQIDARTLDGPGIRRGR